VGALESRASKFLKRLSNFTSKNSGRGSGDGKVTNNPYRTQARSMDVGPKPYMSQPVLALRTYDPYDPMGSDDSPLSTSPASSSPRRSVQMPTQPHPNGAPVLLALPPTGNTHRRTVSTGLVIGGRAAAIAIAPRGPAPDGLPTVSNGPVNLSPGITSQGRTRRNQATPGAVNLKDHEGTMTSQTTHRLQPPSKSYPTPRASFEASPSIDQKKTVNSKAEGSTAAMTSLAATPQLGSQVEDLPSKSLSIGPSPSPAPSIPQLRRAAPRLKSLPPAVFNRFSVDGVRLSPSIVTRQAPMPLMNLPILPLPAPTTSQTATPRARLSSMPALPLQGPTDRDRDSDHENATLEEEEEDEDEYMDAPEGEVATGAVSDDEDGDDQEGTSHEGGRSRSRSRLPPVDTSRINLSFLLQRPSQVSSPSTSSFIPAWTPKKREPDATPTAGSSFDYFSPKPSDITGNDDTNLSAGRTPRAIERPIIPRHPRTPSQTTQLPSPGSARPTIYKHASRSMIDIFSTKQDPLGSSDEVTLGKGKGKARDLSEVERPSQAMDNLAGTIAGAAPAYDMLSHPLRRRRSMPTFGPASLPPPYPHFAPHPMGQNVIIQPRDDEGRERLPPYTNSIYLKAIMPRKMEFAGPGIQAKDRKWRRVLCVLEGTAFKVYKCPPGAAGVGVIGGWWEKKVGVGDVTVPLSPGVIAGKAEAAKRREAERAAKLDSETSSTHVRSECPSPQTQAPSHPPKEGRTKRSLTSGFLKPSSAGSRSHSRSRSEAPLSSEAHSRPPPRPSLNLSRGSPTPGSGATSPVPSHNSTTASIAVSNSSSSSSAHSHFMARSSSPDLDVSEDSAELLRVYTLQHAESGLGNDYLKRKNVIRVRMEGEQFLLQAQNIAAVVEWIEGFHAATNIALDLDERLMPKGPMFPRRRRRRPNPTDTVRPPDTNSRAATAT
jgi:hypothetical protein